MLTYREIDYQKDVPQIVQLLRTSLSENHTEENFLWKHYDNPFGKSYGRLAFDNEIIVGVRMFMFWKFKRNEHIIMAIRPVDTITHTDYRGKGIFKNLTLEGLKDCYGSYDLIYNTPNKESFPGYLKMGWKKYQEDIWYKAAIPFTFFQKNHSCHKISIQEINNNNDTSNSPYFQTFKSSSYLKWRYKDPCYKAALIQLGGKELMIIYKLIFIKRIKTIVVQEIFGNRDYHTKAVKILAIKTKALLIYYLDNELVSFNFLLSRKRQSSVVVFREDQKNLIENIRFTAGDLEGRI